MNDLSLFIYLADVARDLGSTARLLALLLLIASVGATVFGLIAYVDSGCSYRDVPKMDIGGYLRKIAKVLYVPTIIVGLIASLIPSKYTIYLIAASELGEYMLQTDVAQADSQMVTDLFTTISAHLKASLPEVAEAAKEAVK